VRPLTKSHHAVVAQQAALALAYHGDATAESFIFGKLGTAEELVAAFALREHAEERFLAYVDGRSTHNNHALSLVLLLELSEHDGVPERCVSLLSANDSRTRLKAGEAIEHYDDQPKFYRWVYETVNELGHPSVEWDVPAKTLLALSRAITHGAPLVAVRAAQLVGLMQRPDTNAFDAAWDVFESRLSDELARLEKKANTAKKETPEEGRFAAAWRTVSKKLSDLVTNADTFEEALASLAFGAYVGLSRETTDSNAHTVRSAAIGGLLRLADAHPGYRADVRNILLLGLGDPAQNVRERAFDGLLGLNVDHDTISTEALSTGHADMGLRGLELLAGSGGGNELLEKTLLDSTNGLERQAAKLLAERIGEVGVHKLGVGAAREGLRADSVRGLSRAYSDADAANALRDAAQSRFDDVRQIAAQELATHKDPAAFEPLAALAKSSDYDVQYVAATNLQLLGDPRAAGVLLDELEANPELEASEYYFEAVAALGDEDVARRLIDWVDRDLLREDAASTALTL
jgi:ParB family chromosome partitioning protein